MKKTQVLFIAVAVGIIGLYGCNQSTGEATLPATIGISGTEMVAGSDECIQMIDQVSQEALSEGEVKALQFMREEEKLARDVYLIFYDQHQLMPFRNISSSEQAHMDATLNLLNRYELEDPAEGMPTGVFVNEELQKLYDELVMRGWASAVEALKVGALIEEVDIIDIQTYIDESVDNRDIEIVFSNLKRGSTNHLKAFVQKLSRYNIDYTPVLLDPSLYNQLIQ